MKGDRMRRFVLDRVPLAFAAVGAVLMTLTMLWRINPVESSVVAPFLFNSPAGQATWWVLFVTCMPVYILTMLLLTPVARFLWVPSWFPLFGIMAVIAQAIVFFLIGKGICLVARKIRRKRDAPATGQG